MNKAEQIIKDGVRDPRTLPGAIPHQLTEVEGQEKTALETMGLEPDDHMLLRLGIQGMQLIEAAPGTDALNIMALLPKILKQQNALLVLTPEQEAKTFQEAIALVEVRVVLKKDALKGGEE